jgi:aspartyl protease family protein
VDSDSWARVAYLGLLLVALAGWVVVENRRRLGAMARQALAWGMIFLGVVAAYGLWSDIRTEVLPGQMETAGGERIELPRAPDGHYYLVLTIAGEKVRFMVDTGATFVVLSTRDARRVGIDPAGLVYLGTAQTANGTIRTARVRLEDVRLGDRVEAPITAWVGEGELGVSLLGMDYLARFAHVAIAGDRLVLTR